MDAETCLITRSEVWPDETQCAQQAQCWAAILRTFKALTIELQGPLGAGKTTFIRYLLRALGVEGRIKSPSYTVLESYESGGQIKQMLWHFDFYRFNDPQEWEDAGFRDIFAGPGLKLVEWPQHVAGHLPTPDVRLHLIPALDGSRQVRLEAFTPQGQDILNRT